MENLNEKLILELINFYHGFSRNNGMYMGYFPNLRTWVTEVNDSNTPKTVTPVKVITKKIERVSKDVECLILEEPKNPVFSNRKWERRDIVSTDIEITVYDKNNDILFDTITCKGYLPNKRID